MSFVSIANFTMSKVFVLILLFGISQGYPTQVNYDGNSLQFLDTFNLAQPSIFYNPASNVYHLFTRSNPTISQPLVINNLNLLANSNYDNRKRTIVLIHGWMNSATSDFNTVLVPGEIAVQEQLDDVRFSINLTEFLSAEDVNVLVVDWSRGASSINYRIANENCIQSGKAVAEFIDWLNHQTGANLDQYHIIGHGLGGHQAGIVGRNLNGRVEYITGLDPALLGWVNNIHRFQPQDAKYTEVIHTNYGMNGYIGDLAQVDFYPNGGISMPGCDSNACDHVRSFFYFAESLRSGGFTGRQCHNYYAAVLGLCDLLPGTQQMGGLRPKTGVTGVYLLDTNASPPFSQG